MVNGRMNSIIATVAVPMFCITPNTSSSPPTIDTITCGLCLDDHTWIFGRPHPPLTPPLIIAPSMISASPSAFLPPSPPQCPSFTTHPSLTLHFPIQQFCSARMPPHYPRRKIQSFYTLDQVGMDYASISMHQPHSPSHLSRPAHSTPARWSVGIDLSIMCLERQRDADCH